MILITLTRTVPWLLLKMPAFKRCFHTLNLMGALKLFKRLLNCNAFLALQ